ncbi:TonB-dependent receptor plug domain-containing protein [Puniceicoccus vermicola]|uniref:TonB-dependent receptor n=1 Tax=Puniceicoccus vermicola TaxID=388746 RepID=A0A7X1E574_9BACT|nr:TonB-dependent receptor [Puniceicoccus vermicola]MBC2601312.1 TonB-dependent receptor [Puniceicoccus vermicola]
MRIRAITLLGSFCSLATAADVAIDAVSPPVLLPAVATPSATYETPVSALQFDPRVDVQGRLFNEAQADVTVRGGTFESTGFVLGAATLLDPQTGHYFADIPVPTAMLLEPTIQTGSENTLGSFNSTAGSIRWGWAPVREGGQILVGFSQHDGNTQELLGGVGIGTDPWGGEWLVDGNFAHSEGDGDLDYADHQFHRYSGRVQRRSDVTQTDLFAGYQHKVFGLQNLYAAPYDSYEKEDVETRLFLLNHRYTPDEDQWLELTGYYRRNNDDYDFNRFSPNSGNPFVHETNNGGGALKGSQPIGEYQLLYGAEIYADSIDSTSLNFGPYDSQILGSASLAGKRSWEADEGIWTALLGAKWDDSNHFDGEVLPVSRLEYRQVDDYGDGWNAYADISGASQVPGYTAVASSPNGGIFRGNPDLGRETSWSFSLGGGVDEGPWSIDSAVFARRDDNLSDWTYNTNSGAARTANPIDLWVYGLELLGRYGWESGTVSLGYAWLEKDEDYGSTEVDASFYALNYPEHRVTLTLQWDLTSWLALQTDTEWRLQRENILRESSDTALLTDLAFRFQTEKLPGAELWVGVWNLWDDDFQEVPGVPREGQTFFANLAYHF